MATGAQVIKFVLVDFDRNWKRSSGVNAIIYQSTAANAQLAVVHESDAGTATTYRYVVPANEEAWVVEDVIHVPERCVKQEPGNTVKCSG
jgi:hypothetical protein